MKEKEILFLGSSIIQRWKTSKEFPNSLNLGISGLTSEQLQKSYNKKLQQKHIIQNYNKIILYIGSNDIMQNENITIKEIYQNITEFLLYQLSQNQYIHILFVAILKSPIRNEIQNTKIDDLNRKMREFSQKYPNIFFCNINRQLLSENNYLSDKTHLSEKGYSILSHSISSHLLYL
jgi:lysophospholipase L1-like esterase